MCIKMVAIASRRVEMKLRRGRFTTFPKNRAASDLHRGEIELSLYTCKNEEKTTTKTKVIRKLCPWHS